MDYNGRYGSTCNTLYSGTQTTFFRLSQSGAVVSGSIFNVEVSGVVAADGSIGLNGATADYDFQNEAHSTLRPTSDSSRFTGTLNARLGGTWCSWVVVPGAQIIDAHRVAFDTTTSGFTGAWKGSFGVRDCSVTYWTDCYPVRKGTTSLFYLELVQVGSSVSGRLVLSHAVLPAPAPEEDIPVTGTADGNHLVIQGVFHSPNGQETLTLSNWSATRDELGRMSGSFSYVDELHLRVTDQRPSTTSHNVLVGVTLDVAH